MRDGSGGGRRARWAVFSAALTLGSAHAASGADYFVNHYEDAHDFQIDGICDATDGGDACTLRAAVEEALATADDDRVFLGAGTTIMTLASMGPVAPSSGRLTLIGSGPDSSVIVGPNLDPGQYTHLTTAIGTLELRHLRIRDYSGDSGGALRVSSGGALTVEGVVFESNQSVQKGGSITVASGSSAAVRRTRFLDGTGGFGGEVTVSGGTFLCDGCSFENARGGQGGALRLDDADAPLDVRIESSTFFGNEAASGGAIYLHSGDDASSVLVLNSTLTANSAVGHGGAIWASGSRLRVQSSTIASNLAAQTANGSRGGGIALAPGASAALANSILSGNRRCLAQGGHGCGILDDEDCYGTFVSNGYNIVRDVPSGVCSVNGGHFAADPLLLPLAYRGGPTRTRPPAPGSPAIGAGNPAGCEDDPGVLESDQRGEPRPAPGEGVCDLGAVEETGLLFDDDFELGEWKWTAVAP